MLHWIKIKFFFIVYSFFIPFFLFRKKFYYSKFICITIRLKPNGLYNFRHLYDCLTNRIYTYEYFYFHGKVFHSSYFKYYIHVFSTMLYCDLAPSFTSLTFSVKTLEWTGNAIMNCILYLIWYAIWRHLLIKSLIWMILKFCRI